MTDDGDRDLASSRPNILLITTDMHRRDAMGCYGNEVIRTPNLDALAATGVRFTNAFVNNPDCMPSRASLFTGKVPSAHGVRWNCGGLDKHEVTVTRRLRDQGYQTAVIGKMHWGDTEADFGLDHINVTDAGGWGTRGAVTYPEDLRRAGLADMPPVTKDPSYHEHFGAVTSPLPAEHHVDAFVGRAGCEFLAGRDRERPFFCWVSFPGPHLPLDPSEPWESLYDPDDIPLPVWGTDELDTKPPEQSAFQRNNRRGNRFGDYREVVDDPRRLRRLIAHYWGKISMIDAIVGTIVEQLERDGDRENTVIIFTTDHGDFAGNHRLLFKNAFLYDDLIRVPLIISAPDRFPPGTEDTLVEEIDLPATMLELAGLDTHLGVQGSSLLPVIDKTATDWRAAVYAEAVDQRAIRTREWKLVHYAGKPYGELYHVAEDPHELVNRYDDPGCLSVRDELRGLLVDRTVELDARLNSPVEFLELPDPTGRVDTVRLPFI